jgi:anaerobic dimethyl sulfoxide reductase subunit A
VAVSNVAGADRMNREDTVIIPTGGCHDCGGRCVLKVHVQNGVAVRVETDDGAEPQLRACARGRAYRKRVYDPNRLKYPMKRVGTRGEGKFERISWDEALDTVARELLRVRERYGPAAILARWGTGNPGKVNEGLLHRFLNLFGGCTMEWGGPSAESSVFASRAVYGTLNTGHTRDDLVNSRLIIMWGWDPLTSIWSTNTGFYLAKAKEAGARIICIDPRFTDSAAILGDQWIPIRPGTDTALMVAMAHIVLKENLQDQRFLDTYTVGFKEFKDYVMGLGDGLPKTPVWAERITGVSASVIERLAREYASSKPAALIPGYAPGRTAYGEEYHRAAATLAAMTGNVGIHGGGAGGFERGPIPLLGMVGPTISKEKNPVEAGSPSVKGSFDASLRSRTRVHGARIWDAILKGKAGGYPSDIKVLYAVGSNCLNQAPNTNKGVEALKALEFIVVHEQFMTPTARFADILLPASSIWEQIDIARPWLSGTYYIYMNKVIEPMYDSKTDFRIFCELAPRLGFQYSDKTEEEWIREIIRMSPDMSKDIPDYDAFKRDGLHKLKFTGPQICFKKQIEDPQNHPFPTPSGKIEIYSRQLAELNRPDLPPIPQYIEGWEGADDPLARTYPLQLITYHFRTRAHSNFDNIPWLKQLETQTVWVSSVDAQRRGISNGDEVRVFNDRGEVVLPAYVTERIMPGTVAVGQGAWYRPDQAGIDRGGCANVLTKDEYAPGGGWPINTSLVEIRKV